MNKNHKPVFVWPILLNQKPEYDTLAETSDQRTNISAKKNFLYKSTNSSTVDNILKIDQKKASWKEIRIINWKKQQENSYEIRIPCKARETNSLFLTRNHKTTSPN
jgi:hypothetical protein